MLYFIDKGKLVFETVDKLSHSVAFPFRDRTLPPPPSTGVTVALFSSS